MPKPCRSNLEKRPQLCQIVDSRLMSSSVHDLAKIEQRRSTRTQRSATPLLPLTLPCHGSFIPATSTHDHNTCSNHSWEDNELDTERIETRRKARQEKKGIIKTTSQKAHPFLLPPSVLTPKYTQEDSSHLYESPSS